MLINKFKLTSVLILGVLLQLTKCDDIVQLEDNSWVRGVTLVTAKNTTYEAFKGVPYAAPPVGDRRFKPAVKHEPWNDIFNATSDRNICYQLVIRPGAENLTQGEDCLFVSVYVPKIGQGKNELLPVMAWIHGGGFYEGHYSNTLYGPDYLLDNGVVVVKLNYRLGVFGFLTTEDLIAPGNVGLKDQAFALTWINENIEAFGGDPKRVTIFGESAGGMSVSLQVLNKKIAFTYQAAISQSGMTLNKLVVSNDGRQVAFKTAALIDSSFNETSKTSQELVDFLQTVDAQVLNEVAKKIEAYGPVIESEHEDAFLTQSPYELLESGNYNRVPHIIGFNSEEWIAQTQSADFESELASYDEDVTKLVPDSMNIVDQANRTVVGKLIKHLYCKGGDFVDNIGCGVRYISDDGLIRGIIKAASLQAKYSDVYFYRFSYKGLLGQNYNISVPGADRVGHFEDTYYIFNNEDIDQTAYPEEDLRTRERLVKMWTNFAKTLNPTPESDDLLEEVTWPLVTGQGNDSFVYLDIGENLVVKNYPRQETYRVWDFLYSYYGVPPFVGF